MKSTQQGRSCFPTSLIVTSRKIRHTDLQECDLKSNLDATDGTTELSILINRNHLSESTTVTMNPRSTSRKEDDLWDLRG